MNTKKKIAEQKPIIYQTKSGEIALRGDLKHSTIWATQKQIAEIFGIDRSVVTKHINKIFKDKEVDEKSNVQKMHIANSDKPVKFYNLDIILAVGYRTNSARAIEFRRWATKVLKEHITKGYTVNPRILKKNYEEFLDAVEKVQKLLPKESRVSPKDVLELVKVFAGTWFSLDAYDKGRFPQKGLSKKQVKIEAQELYEAIAKFKKELIKKKQATDLFAQEKTKGALEGILGNVFQSVFGKDAYPSIEEKAAHLLYFIVKNHPFNDGNKRVGAFSFIWFLNKAGFNFKNKITPEALTAITLLVAESKPSDKEKMTGIILLLLKGKK